MIASDELEADMSSTEREMLDFEGEFHRWAGRKADLIRERFGLSEVRYYAELNALIDREEALRYAPDTVKRLWRLRDSRRR